MEQPEGYVAPGKKDWVWRLRKGLYGMVQAGRTWDEELNVHIESEEFTATAKDAAIYVKTPWTGDGFPAAGFWVDNCLAIVSGKEIDYLLKSVDLKYGIPGPGDAKLACCWIGTTLPKQSRSSRSHFSTLSLLASTSRSPCPRSPRIESHNTDPL